MEKSQEIGKLAKSLCAFQADMENVGRDAVNPFYHSTYASLENIISAAKPHLKKHGLAFAQFPTFEGLTTVLMHESGEYLSADAKLVLKDATPQGQGSALTYLRRYALSAVLGIATEDDDDANEATKPSQTRHVAPTATKAAKPEKDPATQRLSAKDRILALLKLRKMPCKTKKECEDSVFELTGMMLEEANYEKIADELSAQLDAKK